MQIGYSKIRGTADQCHPAWQDGFKNCLKKLDCNPVIVKLALGRLVIIGDKIEYVQRIVVDSNVSSKETTNATDSPNRRASGKPRNGYNHGDQTARCDEGVGVLPRPE